MSNFREEYEKTYGPMRAARKPISQELHDKLVALCQRNCWLKRHGLAFRDDPCLEADSPYTFYEYEDIAMLKLFFEHGNWSIRQGVVYRDLFFCNQVNGGDEWWVCRYDPAEGAYFPFESVTMKLVIARGEFETLLADMQAATVAQCKHLDYAGRSKCHE